MEKNDFREAWGKIEKIERKTRDKTYNKTVELEEYDGFSIFNLRFVDSDANALHWRILYAVYREIGYD